MADSKINRRCGWCGIRLGLLRVLTLRRYCPTCGPRLTGSAGIYLQSGGPPCPLMDHADDHHAPREIIDPRAPRPRRLPWWRRALCQHCFHLETLSGSFCCECGKITHGLPISPCVPCDEGGRRR